MGHVLFYLGDGESEVDEDEDTEDGKDGHIDDILGVLEVDEEALDSHEEAHCGHQAID